MVKCANGCSHELRPGLTVPAGLELGDVEAGHTLPAKELLGGSHRGGALLLGRGEYGGGTATGGPRLHALGV